MLTELTTQVIQNAIKISVLTIHLVDKNDTRQTGFFSQLPALFGTNLYTAGCANHDQRTVYCSKSSFNLGNEVSKAGSVDEVNLGITPFNRCQSGVNGDLTFDFLGFIVSGGSTVFNLAHSADCSAAIQQGFGNGRGSCSTMTHNGHISNLISSVLFHDKSPFIRHLL